MKRFLLLLLCAVLVTAFALPVGAGEQNTYRAEAEAVITYKMEQSGAEDYADWASKLAGSAGVGAEWYVISLHQLGENVDLGAYSQALADYLSENNVIGVGVQRCALGFLAAGCKSAYIEYAAENSIGSQGIMSYIWGLYLLNNGAVSTKFTPEALAEKIVSFRLADGGFALSGTASNVDVTAMAITALAPYRENAEVNAAIESSLAFLSSAQTNNGGFSSYGAENCESAAQVVIALCALGVDPETDTRFIKNGNSAVDAVRSFAAGNGGFAHTAGGDINEIATQQALEAFAALYRFTEGKGSLFVFDGQGDNTPAGFRDVSLERGEDAPKANGADIKNIVCVAIIAACAVGIAVAALLPKKKKEE